jgi:LPXTG-site transpeptidase (sortase) family protein
MKNIKYYISFSIGLILIVTGIIAWQLRDTNAFMNAEPSVPPAAIKPWVAPNPGTISGDPIQISIPSLKMSLPVINGQYDSKTQTWTLTDYAVQYAVDTPPPNSAEGNTFLYGHYRKSVFENLHNIQLGAEATVTTSNGHTFTYKYVGNVITDPNNTSLFNYSGKPIMTIQTCSGLFYQNRQLFTFNLAGAK